MSRLKYMIQAISLVSQRVLSARLNITRFGLEESVQKKLTEILWLDDRVGFADAKQLLLSGPSRLSTAQSDRYSRSNAMGGVASPPSEVPDRVHR